jgi:quercetin dioxygenase-like cupin family protein
MVLDGQLTLTIGGAEVIATAGTVVRMPANVPHAVDAPVPSRMILTMLREPKGA